MADLTAFRDRVAPIGRLDQVNGATLISGAQQLWRAGSRSRPARRRHVGGQPRPVGPHPIVLIASMTAPSLQLLLAGIIVAGLVTAAECGRTTSTSAAPAAGASAVPGAACQHVNSAAVEKTKFVLHGRAGLWWLPPLHLRPLPSGHPARCRRAGARPGWPLFLPCMSCNWRKPTRSPARRCVIWLPPSIRPARRSAARPTRANWQRQPPGHRQRQQRHQRSPHGAAADGVPAPDQVPSDAQLAFGAR